MSEYARVLDVQELAAFRSFLTKLAEGVRNGLSSSDAEVRDMRHWLDQEQPRLWAQRIKKLQRRLEDARATLRRKKLTPTPTGGPPSTLIETKMVRIAKQQLEHALSRAERTKQWARRFNKEEQEYRGSVQGARNTADATVPQAIRTLDELLGHLEGYLHQQAAPPTPDRPDPAHEESMSRGRDVPPDAPTPTTPTPPTHEGDAQ